MRYEQAVAALAGALTFGVHPSLDGIRILCERLGRPQDAFRVIQVTGTNGKTSTARYTAALLRGEGVPTGLYTSPELERYPERMEVDGRVVSDASFARAVEAAVAASENGSSRERGACAFTEFEILTAAALWLFRERGVEIAVLEVGMGGRWDATSVATPAVAVVTGVALDHVAILGDTIEEIASEKAAIIRPGSVAVLGPGVMPVETVFIERAASVGAPVLRPEFRVTSRPRDPMGATMLEARSRDGRLVELAVDSPAYQAPNVALALTAAEAALGRAADAERARRSLARTRVPGRFEVVRRHPLVVVDGSHNPEAAGVLASAIRDAWPERACRPSVLLGMLADKDAEGFVRALAPSVSTFAVTAPDSPRALAAEDLAVAVERVTGARPAVFGSIPEALAALPGSTPNGLIVTGSLKTAGQARTRLSKATV